MDANGGSIQVETLSKDLEVHKFDALILATGGSYSATDVTSEKSTPFLLKPADGEFSMYEDRKAKI